MDAKEAKNKLRAKIRTTRRALPEDIVQKWNQQIGAQTLEQIDWDKIKSLHSYIAMNEWREVDTWPIIKKAWATGVLVASPRILPNHEMESLELNDKTKLIKNSVGISEPLNTKTLPADFQFDVILVPALAYDKDGYRLGSGSGHYDRFLKTQPNALLIGLSYSDSFIENDLPHEDHDVPMHKIVTEKAVFSYAATPHI